MTRAEKCPICHKQYSNFISQADASICQGHISNNADEENMTRADKIPTTIIHFNSMPDFVMELEYYKTFGGFFKFCGENSIQPSEVKNVEHKLLEAYKYPTKVWEG